ncbi:hypothetical protein KJ652_05070 [Patescibacteria group bacterium]|nr:hypothetical protein [Patescibacteria group bacterium]MBU1123938.1 hypothetical protein [Patescibacteria group bacterium]
MSIKRPESETQDPVQVAAKELSCMLNEQIHQHIVRIDLGELLPALCAISDQIRSALLQNLTTALPNYSVYGVLKISELLVNTFGEQDAKSIISAALVSILREEFEFDDEATDTNEFVRRFIRDDTNTLLNDEDIDNIVSQINQNDKVQQ